MKKIFASALAAFFLIAIASCKDPARPAAQTLPWLNEPAKAFAVAKDKNQMLLLEFSTEWCTYCRFIEEKVFGQPEVAGRLKSFVLLRLDGDKTSSQSLMDEHKVEGFPTFIIFDGFGKELLRFSGVNSPADFIGMLDDLDVDKAGRKELREAEKLSEDDKKEEARAVCEKAYKLLDASGDPKAEDALDLLFKLFKDDKSAALKYGNELLEKYSASVSSPEYYKNMADVFSSRVVKKVFLEKAAGIIEDRIKNADTLDDRTLRSLLLNHIDLLVKIYENFNKNSSINEIYEKGADLAEMFVKKTGGMAANSYIVGDVVDFYTNAGKLDRAEDFLKRAMKELPNYWPVYSNYANVLVKEGRPDDAVAYAVKAYDMAEEVAKPKVALLLADAYIAQEDRGKAIEILGKAQSDLLKAGETKKGRAGKMQKQLEDRIKEYEMFEGLKGK